LVKGALAVTQAANTISATGRVQVKGALAVTQASNTISAAGRVQVKGALAVTQAANTISATGLTIPVLGTLNVTQADQTLVAVATTLGLSVVQDDQTLSATGTVAFSEAPCVLRAAVEVHAIVAEVELSQVPVTIRAVASYARLSASASYPRIRYRTCWNVVADREAA
jgi:hypothetical protein